MTPQPFDNARSSSTPDAQSKRAPSAFPPTESNLAQDSDLQAAPSEIAAQRPIEANQKVKKQRVPKTGFGRIAAKLSGWAANLFVSSIVIVIGLTFGLGLLKMWQEPRMKQATELMHASNDDPFDAGWLQLRLGELSCVRCRFSGEFAQAVDTLTNRCIRVAREQQQRTPSEEDLSSPASGAFTHVLDALARLTPSQVLARNLAVYQLPGPIPMVVVVRTAPLVHEQNQRNSLLLSAGTSQQPETPNQVQSASAIPTAVLSWGIAMSTLDVAGANRGPRQDDVLAATTTTPNTQKDWTLYAFPIDRSADSVAALSLTATTMPGGNVDGDQMGRESSRDSASSFNLSPSSSPLELPEESQITLAIENAYQTALVAFTSSQTLLNCRAHFERQFVTRQIDASAWSQADVGFECVVRLSPDSKTQIRLVPLPSGGTSGLLSTYPIQTSIE